MNRRRNSTFVSPPEALVSSYSEAIFGLLFLESIPLYHPKSLIMIYKIRHYFKTHPTRCL